MNVLSLGGQLQLHMDTGGGDLMQDGCNCERTLCAGIWVCLSSHCKGCCSLKILGTAGSAVTAYSTALAQNV